MIVHVMDLFRNYPSLAKGFDVLLPPGYQIEVGQQRYGPIIVHVPDRSWMVFLPRFFNVSMSAQGQINVTVLPRPPANHGHQG